MFDQFDQTDSQGAQRDPGLCEANPFGVNSSIAAESILILGCSQRGMDVVHGLAHAMMRYEDIDRLTILATRVHSCLESLAQIYLPFRLLDEKPSAVSAKRRLA
ncbi:MAG: hypothetical protein R3C02_10830 [Planctomycetaceae bacterium]